jgi:hypothetical protein
MQAIIDIPKKAYISDSFWSAMEDFLQSKLWNNATILYQIDYDDLPSSVKKSYDNIGNMEFVDF